MVYGMSLNQLRSTMVTGDFSPYMDVTLMVHMMSFHPLRQAMVARDSLNGEVNTFTELRRGDKRGDMRGDRRRKIVTQLCNTALAHSAASQIV